MDQLERLARLKETGALDEEQFEEQRQSPWTSGATCRSDDCDREVA
jgi:hypothetical protein